MLAGAAAPLLERETELAQIEQAVGEALEGRGALAVAIAHAGGSHRRGGRPSTAQRPGPSAIFRNAS